MIIVRHCLDNGRQYSVVESKDYRLYGSSVALYAAGLNKPNYPMPAIVDIKALTWRDWYTNGDRFWTNNNSGWRSFMASHAIYD